MDDFNDRLATSHKVPYKVMIVAGLRLPLVVRPVGDSVKLISPALIARVIDGRVWRRNKLHIDINLQ